MGGVISNTGTWMQRVAQDWLVLELTSSGSALGITTGLQFLPFLLVSPFAGLIADRYPKRQMLALTQASLAVSAGLLGLLAVTGLVEVWHVYVLALLFGVGTAFDAPRGSRSSLRWWGLTTFRTLSASTRHRSISAASSVPESRAY